MTDEPRSPLPPSLSGTWQQGIQGNQRRKGAPRKVAVVPVCLQCRLRAEGVAVSEREQERLIDLEMSRRVTVWLKAKGIVWP